MHIGLDSKQFIRYLPVSTTWQMIWVSIASLPAGAVAVFLLEWSPLSSR